MLQYMWLHSKKDYCEEVGLMKVSTISCFCTSMCMTKNHSMHTSRVAAYEREQFCETNLENSPTTP